MEFLSLLDIEEQSGSDRALLVDPTQEIRADRRISSRTARVMHTAGIEADDEKIDRKIEIKYRRLPTKML